MNSPKVEIEHESTELAACNRFQISKISMIQYSTIDT